jgi:hypothetical protein
MRNSVALVGKMPLTLTLSPQAGRGDGQRGAARPFSPSQRGEGAGRRMRGLTFYAAALVAPLCPAGHLPHQGGERQTARVSLPSQNAGLHSRPLWGRCHGVTEGGNTPSIKVEPTP